MATLTASNVVSNAADSVLSDYAHYTLQDNERYIDTKKWKISYSTNRGKIDKTGDALGTETVDAAGEQSPVAHRLYPLIWHLTHTITAKIECQIGTLVEADEITYESVEQRGSTLTGAKALVPYVSDPEHYAASNTCSGQWWLQNRVQVPNQAAQTAWHTVAESLRAEIDAYEALLDEWSTEYAAWVTEHKEWETAKKKHDADPEQYPDPGPEPVEPTKPIWYGLSAANCRAFTNAWNAYGVTELKTYKAANPATATCKVTTGDVLPANIAYWSWVSPTSHNISTAEQLQQAYTALCGEHELFSDVPWQVWEDLVSRINDIREWLGIPLSPVIDSGVSKAGDPLLASVYNKAVSAIGYPYWTWRDDPTVDWYTGRLEVRRNDPVYEVHILELAKNLNVLIKLGLEASACPDFLSDVYVWFDEYGRIVVFDSVPLYTFDEAFISLLTQIKLEDFESRVLEIEEYISFLYLFYLRDDLSDVLYINQTIHAELWCNLMAHREEPFVGHPLIQLIYTTLFQVFESRVLVLDGLLETLLFGIVRDSAAQQLSSAAYVEGLPSGELLDNGSILLDTAGFTIAADFVAGLLALWTAEFIVDQIVAVIGDFLLLVDSSILLQAAQSLSTVVYTVFRTAASILLSVATESSVVESGEIHVPVAAVLAISELFSSQPTGDLHDQSSTVLSSQEYQVAAAITADIWAHWATELSTDTSIFYALFDALLRTTESQLLAGYNNIIVTEFGNFATQAPFYLTNASVESEVEDMFGNVALGVPGPIPYSNVITYESLKSKMGFGNPAAIGEVSNVELGIFGRMFLDFSDSQNYLLGYLSTLLDTVGELDYGFSNILGGTISEELLLTALIEYNTMLELGQCSTDISALITSLLTPSVSAGLTSPDLNIYTLTSSWLGFLDDEDFIGKLFMYSTVQALMQLTVPNNLLGYLSTLLDTFGELDYGLSSILGGTISEEVLLTALIEYVTMLEFGQSSADISALVASLLQFTPVFEISFSSVETVTTISSMLAPVVSTGITSRDLNIYTLTSSWLGFLDYEDFIGKLLMHSAVQALMQLTASVEIENGATTAHHDTNGAIELTGSTLFEGALPATQHVLEALLERLATQALGYGVWSNTADICGIIDFTTGQSLGTSNVTETAYLRSLLQFSIPWSMGTVDEIWELLIASSIAVASYSVLIGSMESAQSGVASIGLNEYLDTFNSASSAALSSFAVFGSVALQTFFGQDSFSFTNSATFCTLTADLLHANSIMNHLIHLAQCKISDASCLMYLTTFVGNSAAMVHFALAQAIHAGSGAAFSAHPDLHMGTAALLYCLNAIMYMSSVAYVRPCTAIRTISQSVNSFPTSSTVRIALPVDIEIAATNRLVYLVEAQILKSTVLHVAGTNQFLHAACLDMKEITNLASTSSIITGSSLELDYEDEGGWYDPVQEGTDLYVRQVLSIVYYGYPRKYTDLSFDVYPFTIMACSSTGGGTVTTALDQFAAEELSSSSYAASLVCNVDPVVCRYFTVHTDIVTIEDLDVEEQEATGWEYPTKVGKTLHVPQVREITHFTSFAYGCENELGLDVYKRILMVSSSAPATLESTLCNVEVINLANTAAIDPITGVATINSNNVSDWEHPVQTVSVLFVPQTTKRRKYDLTKLEVE